jgi:hypothetical protein
MTSLPHLVAGATFGISGLYGLQDPDLCPTPMDSSWATVESPKPPNSSSCGWTRARL